ncbi:ABC transporter ATP-binding protein [Mucilaginibacter phyllosphaerae]|uniref:ABC transporter ATP-binding protein n=1 Tax=Mucilaginibacter phyllosphaerae TaxID=1812349 RepID=A0A4Y8AA73_9SPHI|nr:ABC transporter ATP-binding protein [Mucilaginibacter phyllosphaerae]MBB3969988.1 ATP-binding cassette subfamily B protein [Mucilaginibacter phyllosphaerae]TEW65357.1 ABC transporter ATP-binding protein [Mucilaginibacter phyllosphaerae]GGH16404.1 ABC transporter ATP-binding protein [Mucilaginibacter phyllosphaerae]
MNILISYLKKHRWIVVLALFLAAMNIGFSLLDPYITGRIVDSVIEKRGALQESEYLHRVLMYVGLAIGVAMISRIAKNFQDYFTNIITQKVGAEMYADGLKHSLELPYQVFEDQRSGETLGILQKVRLDCEKFITSFISILFVSLIGMVFVMVYSVSISYQVLLVYFTAIPIITFVSMAMSRRIKRIQKNIVTETTALAGSTTESLRNIELIKSLGLAKQEIKRLNTTTYKILDLELKKVKYVRSMSFVQGTTVNLVRSAMVVVLLMLIFKGHISAGQYFTFLFYSFFLFNPLQELGNVILSWREAEVSLGNFKNILNTPIDKKPEKPVLLEKIGTLTFADVSFKHLTANRNALNHISFKANSGETIAFVGPSGSGKTTLVKLLVGLYQPLQGDVLYNSISSNEIDLDQLREKIGFVTQDTQLFSGTIRENLLFVNPTATDEECMSVLQRAACQTLLARADKGLDTVIGEGGVKVSGGEKQRLSIARALLRKPDLLVFDEATSSLDSITEEEITDTIRDVSELNDHITILIAHRLSTIMHADCIYVLEKGQIIESGKHHDLIDQKGLYYAMWRQQIGEKHAVDA